MLTEQMLRRSPALAALNPVASAHHEKCDGSGYHKRVRADTSDPAACVLAATEVYVGLTTERADRPPFSEEDAAAELRRLDSEGVLEPRATRAVLVAAGHGEPAGRARKRLQNPGGLSGREVDVLQPCRARADDAPDRRPTRHLPQDRRPPHPAHLQQDRRIDTGRRCTLGYAARDRPVSLGGGRLGGVGPAWAVLLVLCKKSRATVLLRDCDPAAGLAHDLPLGRLHGPPGARCLSRRAVVLLELAKRPAQRGSLPPPSANTARRNAGVVERQLGVFSAFRATPSHQSTLPPARRHSRIRRRDRHGGRGSHTLSSQGRGPAGNRPFPP